MVGLFERLFGRSKQQERIPDENMSIELVSDVTLRSEPVTDDQGADKGDHYDSEAIAFTLDNGFKVTPTDFQIRYKDAQRRSTERRITVEKVAETDSREEYFIKAFCHLRRANRYFRASRIECLIDAAAGEVVAGEAVLGAFRSLLEASPAWHVEHFFACDPGLSQIQCFSFVAKADGRITKAEIEVVADWLREKLPLHVPNETLEDLSKEHLNLENISLSKARIARNRLKKIGVIEETIRVCENIVSQRKSNSPLADVYMAEIRK